jgi:hypothetical protein
MFGIMAGIGAAGMLKGMLEDSPEYNAPSFADIDLQKENPELWKELQRELALADQAEALYNNRRKGATFSEKQEMQDSINSLLQRQGSMGQLGSAVGASQAVSAENLLRSRIAERAFREEQALLGQSMNARRSYLGDVSSAQQAVMAPLQQKAQAEYQNAQQEQMGMNQMFSGLFNGGLSAYGNQQNVDAMRAISANNPYRSMGASSYQGPMANSYQGPMGYTPPIYGGGY